MMKKISIALCIFFLTALHVEASEQIRLGIMPFLSKSSEIKESQTVWITDMLIKTLQASPSISVIERERLRIIAMEHGINVDSEEQNSAMKLGNLVGCKYILLGSATQLTQRYINSKKTVRFLLDTSYEDNIESQEATATLEARLIDVNTGKVVLSFSKSGSVLLSKKDYKSLTDLTTRAIEAATSRLGNKIREVLANEYAMIISVNGNNARINRGSNSGVNKGALYRVYQEGEEVFDLDGRSLGKKMINLAIVRVVDTQSEFSTVEVFSNHTPEQKEPPKKKKSANAKKSKKNEANSVVNLIRQGDKIEVVSFSEAEKLKLATQRL